MSTLKDLARIIADRYDMPRQESEQFITDMFDLLKSGLTADEQVKVKGLGTFKVQTMQERKSVNVNTGEQIVIDSHDRISFTPDASMKESVNKPFSHFETVPLNDGIVFDDIEDVEESNKTAPVIVPLVSQEPLSPSQSEPEVTVPEVKEEIATSVENEVQPEIPETVPAVDTTPEPVEVVEQPENITVSEQTSEPEQVEEPEQTSEPEQVEETEQIAEYEQEPQLKAEPAVTDESDNTSEPTTEPIAESIAKSNAEPSPEPIAVQEPAEATPLFSPESTNSNETDMDYNNDNIDPSKDNDKISTGWALALAFVVLIVGFAIGRATADITIEDIIEKIYPTPQKPVQDTVEFTNISDSLSKDSVAADKVAPVGTNNTDAAKAKADNAADKAAAEKKAAEEKAQAAKAEAEKKAAEAKANEKEESSKYDSDPRVRLGAYRIVGVQKTVTVKEGQTLSSIAKTYLGPGMECYVEVLNNTKEVKAGQQIKIPELKLKKKNKQ